MKLKNRHNNASLISELPLSFGGIFAVAIKNGIDAYVIPKAQLKNITKKDLKIIQMDIKAREILETAKKQAIKDKKNGWTRADFKKDFLKVQKLISKFISQNQKQHDQKSK